MVDDKTIYSIHKDFKSYNAITFELDDQLLANDNMLLNYVYNERRNNRYLIRYPGATRGYIQVDDDNVIINIKIYHDEYKTDSIYKSTVENSMKKFIGCKFIMI